jgi:5-methylcytosine-specific restriction endonuclease McrA
MSKNKAGRPRRDLTEAVIRNAMKHTQSNFQAARYLNVTIETYRKYARLYIDQESGKTLYELHKNNSGKGIKRVRWKHEISIDKINEIMSSESYRAINQQKLKNRLIYEGILKMECYKCGHHEKRVVDYKQPLILSFKNGNKNNWKIDNLEMLCYNCYFLYIGNLFPEKQIMRLEDANATILKKGEIDWQVDESFLQHFKELGLEPTDDYEEGDEYISKI